jgi:hypothetical protein
MTSNVLMPKATAVWLIENTSLTFKQAPIPPVCTRSKFRHRQRRRRQRHSRR